MKSRGPCVASGDEVWRHVRRQCRAHPQCRGAREARSRSGRRGRGGRLGHGRQDQRARRLVQGSGLAFRQPGIRRRRRLGRTRDRRPARACFEGDGAQGPLLGRLADPADHRRRARLGPDREDRRPEPRRRLSARRDRRRRRLPGPACLDQPRDDARARRLGYVGGGARRLRSAPTAATSIPTSTASIRPIRASCRGRAGSTRCRSRRCSRWPRSAPRFCRSARSKSR